MKRIILFENGIETLSFFSKQLAKAFEKENMECFLFDLEEEEKTEFDVELTDVGPNKVKVIKVVRELTGLGLKEAKEVVDNAPKVIKEGAEKAEAEDIKAKLEAEGAKITLK